MVSSASSASLTSSGTNPASSSSLPNSGERGGLRRESGGSSDNGLRSSGDMRQHPAGSTSNASTTADDDVLRVVPETTPHLHIRCQVKKVQAFNVDPSAFAARRRAVLAQPIGSATSLSGAARVPRLKEPSRAIVTALEAGSSLLPSLLFFSGPCCYVIRSHHLSLIRLGAGYASAPTTPRVGESPRQNNVLKHSSRSSTTTTSSAPLTPAPSPLNTVRLSSSGAFQPIFEFTLSRIFRIVFA